MICLCIFLFWLFYTQPGLVWIPPKGSSFHWKVEIPASTETSVCAPPESGRPRFHKVGLHLGGYSLLGPVVSHSCVSIWVCKGGICFLMTLAVPNPGPVHSMINRLWEGLWSPWKEKLILSLPDSATAALVTTAEGPEPPTSIPRLLSLPAGRCCTAP